MWLPSGAGSGELWRLCVPLALPLLHLQLGLNIRPKAGGRTDNRDVGRECKQKEAKSSFSALGSNCQLQVITDTTALVIRCSSGMASQLGGARHTEICSAVWTSQTMNHRPSKSRPANPARPERGVA